MLVIYYVLPLLLDRRYEACTANMNEVLLRFQILTNTHSVLSLPLSVSQFLNIYKSLFLFFPIMLLHPDIYLLHSWIAGNNI